MIRREQITAVEEEAPELTGTSISAMNHAMLEAMKFNCEKCPGYCCSHGRIAVSDYDIERLAKHAGISATAARKKFTFHYKTKEVDEQLLRHHKDTIYKSVCRFFDRKKRQCTVYEARPNVCRKYPYGNKCGYYEFLHFERAHQDDEKFVPTIG